MPESGRMLLSHEWIESIGGSENVFRHLIETFPESDALCLWNDIPSEFGFPTNETWLANTKLRESKVVALPFMRSAWKRVDISTYETVVASSHAFGHHLASRAAREGKRAFAYVHSPARYVWVPDVDRRGGKPIARIGRRPFRAWDLRAIDPRVSYAANSEYVAARIADCWGQDARVIYPPVDVEKIRSVASWRDKLNSTDSQTLDSLPKDGFILGASRLVPYKRIDLAITVGEQLGMPVVIAGSGPSRTSLQGRAEIASVPVHMLGRVSDELLFALYQSANLFVFLGVEDFGIMPVEAVAAGCPVLVNSKGGARESVISLNAGAEVNDLMDTHELATAAERAIHVKVADTNERVGRYSIGAFMRNARLWVAGNQ